MNPSKIALAPHHSVVDWDFEPGQVHELDSSYYVSSPTSLHLGHYPTGTPDGCVLCRVADTLVIPDGRIITAARQRSPTNQYRLVFRNQAALGTANMLNCYRIRTSHLDWMLERINDGTPTAIGGGVTHHEQDAWMWLRITFYSGADPGNGSALVFTYEHYLDGEWVQQGAPAYDAVDAWKDSGINRLGLATFGLFAGWEQWYDDTEIWGPAV